MTACPRCGAGRPRGAGCSRPQCGWTPASTRRQRPSRHARGLGADHDRMRRRVLAEETHCVLCNQPVDLTLPGTHPDGPTAHHLTARAHGGDGTRANYRLAHKLCNEKAGAA